MSCRAPSKLVRRQGAPNEQVETFDRGATKLAGNRAERDGQPVRAARRVAAEAAINGAGARRVSQPPASATPQIPTQTPADAVRQGISTVS